jgi:hypothetical protein
LGGFSNCSGNNSVRLTYADRNDTHTSYLAGSKLQQTKRLNNIITYANDNSIRTYDLEYQYYGTPKKSQLTSRFVRFWFQLSNDCP